jgi:di/tricarboxylate transporter
LFKTGAVNFIGPALIKLGKRNSWLALITMMIAIGAISAFINNTAAVAIFLPIVVGAAREVNISPSKLLMPLSFASMFGGVCTLIGTSTNILVNSIAQQHGQPAFGMFEFSSLGFIFFGSGLLYMLLVGVHWIPSRRTEWDLTQNFQMRDYLTEVVLLPESKSVGTPLAESPLVHDLDIDIIGIYRDGTLIGLPAGETILQANDTLRVRCDVQKIKQLQEREGVVLKPDLKWRDKDPLGDQAILVEAVIAPNSSLEGKSMKEARFRNTFGATALAIRHRGELMHEQVGTTPLRAGDALLIEIKRDHLAQLRDQRDFVIVSEVGLPEFRRHKILPALVIIFGVVLTATLGLLPIVVSAIVGCVLLVLTGCLKSEEAYKAIEWNVIFLLAGVLTLGVALEKTGAALYVSNLIVSTVGVWGPVATVSAFYLLTSLLTETMSNNATAALLAPIAIATAEALGLNPRPFLMAVTFAASASFMTPVGYQTNTLIYGPGQYKFADFLRVGTPLNILFWLLATLLIPRCWPFSIVEV